MLTKFAKSTFAEGVSKNIDVSDLRRKQHDVHIVNTAAKCVNNSAFRMTFNKLLFRARRLEKSVRSGFALSIYSIPVNPLTGVEIKNMFAIKLASAQTGAHALVRACTCARQ